MWAVARILGGGGLADAGTSARAVGDHLARLLNARQGRAPAAPDYGVEGGAERLRVLLDRWPHSLSELEAALWRPIAAFEPRLQPLRWAAPTELGAHGLRLILAGHLRPWGAPVAYSLHLDPRGHVAVALV